MNQNLPKPVLDALTRQAVPTEHPSADVLNAFAEDALAGNEYQRTADHLSRCGECREIVFLASNTADKPLHAEERVAAVEARRRWTPRLIWGMSIAGAVLVSASTLLWWRMESAPARMQMAAKAISTPAAQPTEQTQQTPPATDLRATAELATPQVAVAKPQAKTARAKPVSPQGAETLGVGSSAGVVAGALPAPVKAPPGTTANADSVTIAISGTAATTAPAPPPVNSFAATQGGPLAVAPGSADKLLMSPQAAVRSLRAAPQWRITADGHLLHSTAEGWTRVLPDQTATFRVVSVVGNQVWAGGSGGALFHSRDSGQNWEEVTLNTPDGRETATIVSIQFDDAQHGTVTTDNGTRCVTTDGGGSWTCVAAAADSPK